MFERFISFGLHTHIFAALYIGQTGRVLHQIEHNLALQIKGQAGQLSDRLLINVRSLIQGNAMSGCVWGLR